MTSTETASDSHRVDQSIADRLRLVLARRQTSASGLSKAAGLARGHVGLILSGTVKGNVQPDTLKKIAAAAGVAYEWLATGAGESGLDVRPAPIPTASAAAFGDLPGWAAAESEARRRYPGVPPFAFRKVARTSLVGDQPRTISAELVADLAKVWLRHASDEELSAADEDDADADIAALRARRGTD